MLVVPFQVNTVIDGWLIIDYYVINSVWRSCLGQKNKLFIYKWNSFDQAFGLQASFLP